MSSSLVEVVGNPFGRVSNNNYGEHVLYIVEIFYFPKGMENDCHTLRFQEIEEMLFVPAWCVAYSVASVFDGKMSM